MSDTRRWIDLHMHSTASDGAFAPAVLMNMCAARGLSAVALTDHDTTAGLEEASAAAKAAGIEFVPGAELAATLGPYSVHLLCYLFDPMDADFLRTLEQIRVWRRERNEAIAARLGELGIHVDLTRLAASSESTGKPGNTAGIPAADTTSLGRPHFARALIAGGHARDFGDAFGRYLGRGGAAYVPRRTMTPEQAIAAVTAAGGIVSLAHPCQVRCQSRPELETVIGRLKDVGLGALEVYHSDHSDVQTRHYVEIAKRMGLAMTGGSDFHGRVGMRAPNQGVGFSHVRVERGILDMLRRRRDRIAAKAG